MGATAGTALPMGATAGTALPMGATAGTALPMGATAGTALPMGATAGTTATERERRECMIKKRFGMKEWKGQDNQLLVVLATDVPPLLGQLLSARSI